MNSFQQQASFNTNNNIMHPIFLLLFIISQVTCSIYWDEYVECRDSESFGNSTLVCDTAHRLSDGTRQKLSKMLESMQNRIGCECADGCLRENGRDDFIGILHVSTSKASDSLKDDVKKEYTDAKLGNASCDHGLVLVYLKDTQQLATYRGGDSFVLLTPEDMEKLHTLALKGQNDDSLALQFLLTNYKDVVENPVQRSQTGILYAGLGLAILVVLVLIAILTAIFCAKCCCCCYKRKTDKYQVNTLPSYKTIEPLYVVTPPPAQARLNRAMSDAIYSTPYSGSPLPYPPPPGGTVPMTPSTSSRNRIHPEMQSARSEPGSIRRMHHPEFAMPPPEAFMPVEIYGTIPRATLSVRTPHSPTDANDIKWLDPNRKQETQTREELIY